MIVKLLRACHFVLLRGRFTPRLISIDFRP